MENDRPLIAILMAVYDPRMDWLREQLLSLDAQTYPNLMLYIRDDCSPTVSLEEIRSCASGCLSQIPYRLERNNRRLGSNGTFELLTGEAEGEFFAYCDQDDVWLPEKLVILYEELRRSNALLVCSDMFIINAEGRQTANSMKKIRRHHVFHSGGGLAEGLLVSNFVTGCTMLVQSRAAKEAIPFCPYMVHDHYIALCCAAAGEIMTVMQPLIRYRVHGGNQTGLMAGVTDRASYVRVRVELPLKKFEWLAEKWPYRGQLCREIQQRLEWMQARLSNLNRNGGAGTIWRYRRFSPLSSLFELFAPWMPEQVFMGIIRLQQKNIL